jgi:DNA polymerase III delta subunit
MIRIFSGEDTYESYNLAKIQLQKLQKDSNLENKILNADEITDPSELIQYLEGVGMFSDSYIIFLKRLSANKKLLEYFTQNYTSLKNYDIVIWEDKKVDSRLKFFQTAKKEDLIFSYDSPKDSVIRIWLNDKVREMKLKLTTSQIEELIVNIGTDKWHLQNELQKLSVFQNSKKEVLNPEEFDRIVSYDIEGDIWKFVDAFSNRDKIKCLQEVSKILKTENNSQYAIAMLVRELSLLAQVLYCKEHNLDYSELKVHPFVLQKMKSKVNKFKFNDIKFLTKKIFDLDFAIKKGNIDEKVGLSLFILAL